MKVRHSGQWQDADVFVRHSGQWEAAEYFAKVGNDWLSPQVKSDHILSVKKSPQDVYGLIFDANGRYGNIDPDQHENLTGFINGLGYRERDGVTFFNINNQSNTGKTVDILISGKSTSFFVASSGWTDIASGDYFNLKSQVNKDIPVQITV